jgi:7-keto-8-aminopelargonate synthetase-like enzyme
MPWAPALAALADLHGKEAALVVTSAYVASDATLSALLKLIPGTVVFSDEKNHASMIEGSRYAMADIRTSRRDRRNRSNIRQIRENRRSTRRRAVIIKPISRVM